MEFDYVMHDNKEEEDDESSLNAKVVELLKAKVKLDNGEDGYVFTKNTDDNPRGRFRCHVCNVRIGSTKSLQEHSSGKNHTRRMQANFHSHENFSKIVIKESSKLCTDLGGKVIKAPGVDIPDLAPGEPVPPGFEDIVTRVPEITSTLDAMKAPLIGLEYLAEITPVGDEIEPKYCCLLCNKRGDPRTVLAHLVCFNHRIKYIGSYFPKTSMALALIPKVKEYKRGTGEVLAKIARAIENKFGRLNPVIVDGAIFDEKKEEYYREMRAGRHFYETADSNYEKLVDLDFIKKCVPETDTVLTIDMEKEEAKKRSTALKIEMIKSKNKNTSEEKKSFEKRVNARTNATKGKREKSIETISSSRSRSYSRSRSRSCTRSRSRSRSHSRSRSRSRSKSRSRPRPNYRYLYRNYEHRDGRSRSPRYYCRSRSRSRSRSHGPSYRRYRSSNYRTKSPIYMRSSFRTIRYDSLYKDDEDYASSEKPKSTQLKVAELRDRRKKRDLFADYVEKLEKEMAKSLKSYKKNPEKHPLYPEEWKKFWNRRYKELTAEGVDASKHDFKPEWIKFWLVRMKELHNEELEMKKAKYRAELGLSENENSGGIDSDVIEVSPTPLEDDKSNVTVEDIKNTWRALTGNEIKSVKEKSPEKSENYEWESVKSEPEQPVRVITVLRLLTALESQLGSLGPRVNNLLAQAIALEKKKPSSSDTLIDISENNVLFETVKEKLKGQLFAGIVPKHMVNATRTAIQNVAELFNTWKLRKENPEPVAPAAALSAPAVTPMSASSEPLIVPGIGAVDKLAIAQQITAALIAQGKTNVTEQELEQLINAVVGMAQATTRQTATAPIVSTGYYPTPAPQTVSPVIPPTSVSSGVFPVQRDMGTGSKPSIFQQLVTPDTSNSNWNFLGSGLKTYDETVPSKIRKGLFSKNVTELSEEDMKSLVQNFKDLSPEDQQSIIAYLKELESEDPDSVEKLRKFVSSTGENFARNDTKPKEETQATNRLSPFSMREGGANPSIEDGSKINSKDLDDDEDDYSFEDIYKAAEKKISGKSVVEQMIEEQQKKAKFSQPQSPHSQKDKTAEDAKKNADDPERVLSEAKVMIANIMGQLPSKYTGGATRNITAKGVTTNSRIPPPSVECSTILPNYTGHPAYDSNPSNISIGKSSNNLLNDYNYQDDIFGYSNENYSNYQSGNESYPIDTNSHESYNERQYQQQQQQQPQQQPVYTGYANSEQSYNSYETWNDSYSQYPPVQQTGYNCPPPHPPTMVNTNFNRPPGPYQGSPSNDYNGPSLYSNSYREYY